jgi:hypothetical protein
MSASARAERVIFLTNSKEILDRGGNRVRMAESGAKGKLEGELPKVLDSLHLRLAVLASQTGQQHELAAPITSSKRCSEPTSRLAA